VPHGPGKGQVTEAQFIRGLAERMYERLPTALAHGEGRQAGVDTLTALLDYGVREMVGGEELMDRWLRQHLGFTKDPVTVDEYYAVIFERYDFTRFDPQRMWDLTQGIEDALAGGPDEQQSQIDAIGNPFGSDKSFGLAQKVLAGAPGAFAGAMILWWPGGRKEPKWLSGRQFVRYTQRLGNKVHTIIQAHYWYDHPDDLLMFEDFFVLGPRSLGRIYQVARMEGWAGVLRVLLAGALTGRKLKDTTAFATKRPDILNLRDLHEQPCWLYEIKPVDQIADGLRDLADYLVRLNRPPSATLFAPGTSGDWRPFPVYPTGGNTCIVAWLHTPGLIIYQRLGARAQPMNVLRLWKFHTALAKRLQEPRGVAVATLIVMLIAFVVLCALAAKGGPAALATVAVVFFAVLATSEIEAAREEAGL
jgi:hypothetical protein